MSKIMSFFAGLALIFGVFLVGMIRIDHETWMHYRFIFPVFAGTGFVLGASLMLYGAFERK